jgi:mono/diheme cytochrome c family protein
MKGRTSCLKKINKKLLLIAASIRYKVAKAVAPAIDKSFLVLFFKRELRAFLISLSFPAAAHAAPGLATLYTWHCSGCHGADGRGVPAAGIPDLHDAGAYVVLPEGRAYLAQVPGISQSHLDDATAARILNYVLARFSAASLPADFAPYTAEEIGRLRADRAKVAPTP